MDNTFAVAEERKMDTMEVIRHIYRNMTSQRTTGGSPCLAALDKFFSLVGEAFPDYELTIHNLFTKEDKVMARYSITGIQKDNFMGIEATQRRMTIAGIDVFKLDKGEVVAYWDAAHQIGVF